MTTAYTLSNGIPLTALPNSNGVIQKFLASTTNPADATFAPDSLAAAPIFGLGAQALEGNEIVAGGIATLVSYIGPLMNSGALCWVLLDCAGGTQQVANATQSQHAITLGQAQALLSSSQPQLQPLTATVTSALITANLAVTPLEFRSPTLTTGSGTTIVTPTLSIATPTIAASLGAVSGVQAQLAVLVAYNAGSSVLCLSNMAGGLDLSETGLISPTTISAGATSASAIYSASAVAANSPYRIVGYLNATWTSGTGWTLNQVQPYGGQAMAAMQSVGFGQTWQAVTRVNGTTYYNTTGKPITLKVDLFGGNAPTATVTVNGVNLGWISICQIPNGNTAYCTGSIVIPPGASYSISATGINSEQCYELR